MATSYDFSPLCRSSVGFDQVFNLLENVQRARSVSDWPLFGVVKTGDDSYRISVSGLALRRTISGSLSSRIYSP